MSEKGYFCNPAICNYKNGKHVESIIGDSVVICNEIIDTTKTILIKIYLTKTVTKCALINFYISLFFLLITIALLIATSIYCYLIEYRAKQKHLLLFHNTSKLKKISIKNIL